MSLILDALSRAEGERRAQPGAADILSPTAAQQPGMNAWPWLITFCALALVVFLAWLLWQSESATAPTQVEPPRSAQLARADLQPTAPPVDTTITARRADAIRPRETAAQPAQDAKAADAADAEDVAALYAQPHSRPVASSPPAAGSPVAAETRARAERNPVQPAAGSGEGGTPDAALQLEDVDLARVLRDVRAESEAGQLAPHPVPLLATLSKQFRDALPTLMYLRHDYSSSGRSTVVINGETLAPGQRSRGVEVREVLPDSVILRYGDTDFRLRALNSWVNL
jgi:hypothetical protein